MIKFAVKTGLAAGAVYYTAEQGVWKDSVTTAKLYESIKTNACPYVKQATDQLPFELPTLPKTDNASSLGRVYWNNAVKGFFGLLLNLPSSVQRWSSSGVEYFQSFSQPPSVAENSNEKQ